MYALAIDEYLIAFDACKTKIQNKQDWRNEEKRERERERRNIKWTTKNTPLIYGMS